MTFQARQPRSVQAFTRRFLARVPPEIAATFSADQLAAVHGMRYAVEHAVDWRRSIPLPWGRYYFVLLAGRDRPAAGRSGRAFAVLLAVLALATVLTLYLPLYLRL
jgi:hypothetical protein